MLLSVIIVSYNVKYFLEQCLFSVIKALGTSNAQSRLPVEVIVVDNASSDGTLEYLSNKFRDVKFIRNRENLGYARANNQGLELATGKFVLFLNPDTVAPEEIFNSCISFFDAHPATGAVGVRMVDGSGNFLPESKRGFPTAWRSFCKLSGLSSLMPSSKIFAGYSMGYLNEHGVFPIEVIAGAFMMIRKEAIAAGFDERFFMYAEDIDLSKRIKDRGFENYYLGNLTILHFKGESTAKDARYVKSFYDAMNLYIKKHYTSWHSRIFIPVMKLGIWIRSLVDNASVRKDNKTELIIDKVQYRGDAKAIRQLRNQLTSVEESTAASIKIFCEGADFSFSQLIESLEKLPATDLAMVHAAGSNSIVGSSKKAEQGHTIALTSS